VCQDQDHGHRSQDRDLKAATLKAKTRNFGLKAKTKASHHWHTSTAMSDIQAALSYGFRCISRRRSYHVASEGRSVAPRWLQLVAHLHRSAGGIVFPDLANPSLSGSARAVFPLTVLGGRLRDRSTWQWRACVPGHLVVVLRRDRRGRYDGGGWLLRSTASQ